MKQQKNNTHIRIEADLLRPLRIWCAEENVIMKYAVSNLVRSQFESLSYLDSIYRWFKGVKSVS
jgi:hypothetical protein